MHSSTLLMLLVLVLGIVGKSNIIAAAAGILLVLQYTNLHSLMPILERRGLEIGLVFLVVAVLVPFATGRIPPIELLRSFATVPGIIAIISGAVATVMNGHGLELLKKEPALMIGLVVGSIVGVITFGGIPVGPLMAGGIAAILLGAMGLIK